MLKLCCYTTERVAALVYSEPSFNVSAFTGFEPFQISFLFFKLVPWNGFCQLDPFIIWVKGYPAKILRLVQQIDLIEVTLYIIGLQVQGF